MKSLLCVSVACLFLLACEPSSTPKYNGPLIPESELPSKTYSINADSGAVIQDPSGKILVIPENAFEDADGNSISGNVQVEFTVHSKPSDILLAGFSSNKVDEGTVGLETVFTVQVSQNGKELELKANQAISYFGKEGNSVFLSETIDGKTKWTKKVEPEKFLTTVPLSELNFCPTGIEPIIEKYLSFNGYSQVTDTLRDSLYYSTSARIRNIIADSSAGKDTFSEKQSCNIDPALIKTLKQKKFENTLVATKEFEARMVYFHQYGKSELLQVYLNDLDKPMWQLDSAVASISPSCAKKTFLNFAAEKKGRVEKRINSEKYQKYIAKEKDKLKKQIAALEKKYQNEHQQDVKELQNLKKQFRELLVKRQEFRLTKLEEIGWHAEGPWVPVGIASYKIGAGAIKGKFDRIYAFLILPEIKSIISLDVNPETGNFRFFPEDKVWGYIGGMKIWAIAVCIKADKFYFDKKELIGGGNLNVDLSPTEISKAELDEKLAYEKSYMDFNKIEVEIELREKIHAKNVKIEEHRRIERMMSEITYHITHSCSCCDKAEASIGVELFNTNCSPCHNKYKDKIGPALIGVSKRRNREFIKKFIQNSQQLIKVERDPVAMELYAKYNNTEMISFPELTDCEIESIILYLEKEEIKEE